jgi:predicted esterase
MTWREHELRVARSARFYTAGDVGASLRECWIACHGYGQLAARFARSLEPVVAPHRCVIVPEALSRFYVSEDSRERVGASWMTKEHRLGEINDYVEYLDAVCDHALADNRRTIALTAFGFSQGAATASRWLALGRHRFARLILWGGELPPDLELAAARERFAGVAVTLVRGTKDEYITAKVLAGMRRRLDEQRIEHDVREFDGGHEIDGQVLAELGRSRR